MGMMIPIDKYGFAIDGTWHTRYLTAWKKAFPNRPTEEAGRFEQSVWCSLTPEWDNWWFGNLGAKPPRLRTLR